MKWSASLWNGSTRPKRLKVTYSTIAGWLGQVFSPELADALK